MLISKVKLSFCLSYSIFFITCRSPAPYPGPDTISFETADHGKQDFIEIIENDEFSDEQTADISDSKDNMDVKMDIIEPDIKEETPEETEMIQDVSNDDSNIQPKIRDCIVRLKYNAKSETVTSISVRGEFNDWKADASPMNDSDQDGIWEIEFTPDKIQAGEYAYKFFKNGSEWLMDPENPYIKYVNQYENSKLIIPDCNVPLLKMVSLVKSFEGEGKGKINLTVEVLDGIEGKGLKQASQTAFMNGTQMKQEIYNAASQEFKISLEGLSSGKYSFRFLAENDAGKARVLFIPVWLEEKKFEWKDAILYFAFTDRFNNGSKDNDKPSDCLPPENPANWKGGDFKGITQKIKDNYFQDLGVNTIWISPANDNPDGCYSGELGKFYTAYHGYFPVKITSEPDEHFGTPEELRELTAEAHKHGIRILMDFVGNHVHQDAEIYKTYKNEGWFYSYFLCGYDEKPIECWFQPYLPDINYSVNDAVNTFTDSAIEWIEEADLDGFRVDAVKHMLHNFTRTLRAKIEEQIVGESGTDFYMVGETFVAQWDFTAQKTQGLIKQYINDWELDGQFNFPLYWEIIREIARNEDSFVKMAAVVEAYIAYFGEGAFLMSNFLGNHDIARFISHANNNILDMWSNGSKELGWSNPPALPSDSAPFKRLQVAFSFLMTIPGIPLIYYGDEIGMPGAGDPDNRRMMYFSGLNSDQNELKTHVGKVAIIRSNHKALRQGTLKNLVAETDIYAYLREDADDRVIIALNKASSQKFVEIPVSLIPFASAGDTFHDELSGADFKIAGGKLAFPLDPISSAILVKK